MDPENGATDKADVQQPIPTAHKEGVRTGDKDNEEVFIPKNRLILVFIGLMLTTFLAALDQTIVCMATTHMQMR